MTKSSKGDPGGPSISATGGTKRESKADRALRYEAQLIATKYGKSFVDALDIAKLALANKSATDNSKRAAKQKEVRIRTQQRHDRKKKEDNIYPVYGLPLQGGIPGLGKRK